jgi:hypothetical protein
MRIGPYAPVCACAHALPCEIARAHACICLSRVGHHNLTTCVRTQLSMPQEPARTRTHTRACAQAGSDSDAAEAGSDADAEPIVRGGAVIVSNSGSESEDDKPIVRSAGRGAEVDSDSDSDSDAASIDPIGDEVVTNTPIGQKRKRNFKVVVDDEIEIEEAQIRAQMVRWSCFSAALRRSLRMILSDCR